jgi:hypothetical protein
MPTVWREPAQTIVAIKNVSSEPKHMAALTLEKALRRLKAFLPIFGDLAACVITDPADQANFDAVKRAALGILDGISSACACSDLETLFGLMAVLFIEAPLLESKPRDQVQMLIDEIEYLGAARYLAAGTSTQFH